MKTPIDARVAPTGSIAVLPARSVQRASRNTRSRNQSRGNKRIWSDRFRPLEGRLAVTALTKISIAKKERLLENSAGRLKLWGVGLFENGLALDDVLLSRSSKDCPLYRILVATLVDILLLEGEANLHSSRLWEDC
jgi:hypothetical protein